ncbi:MAG: hypothetical protein OTI34_17485, partial [Lewinella sp.]|nr:hypothetical protein [Lewinella sp.]
MPTKAGDCIEVKLYLPLPTITLEVVTFSKFDDSQRNNCNFDNGSKLNGSTVDLSTSANEQILLSQDASEINKDSNSYSYSIELERYYKISGRKNGYTSDPDTAFVDTRDLFVLNDTVICRKLLLERLCLTPKIFFGNNIPVKDPNMHTITPANYMDTYDTYVGSRKNSYYKKWADKAPYPNERETRDTILDLFFSEEVDKGAKHLEDFAAKLKVYLKDKDSLTVTLQGFASPRAGSVYNDKLSVRRCISVINYLWNYEGEALQQYMKNAVILIDNKALKVSEQDFYKVPSTYAHNGMNIPIKTYQGDTAPPQIGKPLIFHIKPGGEVPVNSIPNLSDTGDNSIYSPVAAAQRYVEITIEGCGKQAIKKTPKPPIRED